LSAGRREELAVAALAVVPLLPFLGAAVSLDAPVFLAVARQVLAAPADPFGFEMIWDPVSPDAAVFNLNPPLLSYYLAPWIALFGEREVWLHAALLPFPLVAALSFLGIARRAVGEAAGVAAALLVATPAFLVLATTLLLDVPALAFLLLGVYALLRGAEAESRVWPAVAGVAAALAGLTKYAAAATAPLLVAGVLLLQRRRRAPALAWVLGVPAAAWSLWGLWTAARYGTPHFLGGVAMASERSSLSTAVWNQVVSLPIYYGGALVFPLFAWGRLLGGRGRGIEWGVLALVLGAAGVAFVLPRGMPPRRYPIDVEEAVLAAVSFAAALTVWAHGLARWRASPLDGFLVLWLAGFAVFSLAVNWHVNAADALLAAPPALLLMLRTAALRPSRRAAVAWVALSLALSLLLAWAEMRQADVYRTAARGMAREIGGAPGQRWFFGNWGFQYYLEREGFRAVAPRDYGPDYPHELPAVGDWIATARNLSQLNVTHVTQGLRAPEVWSLEPKSWLPLHTTNPDAGAGFYSHHMGYVPWAWYTGPLERIQLGRVRAAPPRRSE
jgi:hypothetical protein